ncbi:hypothetical protein [Sedimentitalea todarodis]|uniref:Major facilitator superfamily (MFS) profile domain-containing protein n=1 Tax=Sedimentitalea todarodis TaxID=1631240 RepID=A0ABU3VD41_9RHOB|nr:hypothetical protein [Sedimentitalea todarodis]MDU9004003.1 hypothetical protein [Sedimentitalea todarodis]
MLAHLVLSVAFGLIAALIGAMMGTGFGSVVMWYFVGCWAGFLFSVVLQLTLRSASRSPASSNVRRATS